VARARAGAEGRGGIRSGCAGHSKWACGVFKAAQAGTRGDVARVPAEWAARTGYGGVDDAGGGVGGRSQRLSWSRSGTVLRWKEAMEVLDAVDRACSAGMNLSNQNL
jgi:hypothetical protein